MKLLSYIIPIISILILLLFLIVIQLDIKFSFGVDQTQYVFKKGQELAGRANMFISLLVILDILLIGIFFLQGRKNKKN